MNTAAEEWAKLNRAINCKHYIGPRAHKTITDALNAENEVVVPEKVIPKAKPTPAKPKPKATVSK